MKILITGGCGFIGSALVRHLMENCDHDVVNIDALTYAAMPEASAAQIDPSRYTFEHADICDAKALPQYFSRHQPDAIMHLAAESHVDRSIGGPSQFIQTNILGTYNLLEVSRQYYESLTGDKRAQFRFHHISTDEVYGDLEADAPPFDETTPYQPSSPYSASKASSDHLVRAWHRTYGLPTLISNCSNNYGPWQFPEKLIPVALLKAISGENIPVYGNGSNRRDWLFVDDHVRALVEILTRGKIGETYNVGGGHECSNLELVTALCAELDQRFPQNAPHSDLITFVKDRPGHDKRYAINNYKLMSELNWKPEIGFERGLKLTVDWYIENRDWCESIANRCRQGIDTADG